MLAIKGLFLLVVALLAIGFVVWGLYLFGRFIYNTWVSDETQLRLQLEETIRNLQKELKN